MMLFCERLKSREACKHLKVLNNTIYNHVGKLESNFILNWDNSYWQKGSTYSPNQIKKLTQPAKHLPKWSNFAKSGLKEFGTAIISAKIQ